MNYNSGILYAVAAGLIWGLAFIIPKLLPTYSAIEITCGRYFVYGIISLILCLYRRKSIFSYNNNYKICLSALLFAFCGNVAYYLFLVLAIQLAGVTISTLIIGMLPITVSLYGNWLFREFSFKKVFPPVLLVLGGIMIINFYKLQHIGTFYDTISGLFYGFLALALWTWYGVANARFLKDNPQISSKDWSTITGLATFILFPFFLVFASLSSHAFSISHLFLGDENSTSFWLGSITLGFFCSWVATVFWNKASNRLPATLTGQLIVSETLFGLLYGYIFEHRFPYYFELIGIIIIISGVIYSIHIINAEKRLIVHDRVQEEQSKLF